MVEMPMIAKGPTEYRRACILLPGMTNRHGLVAGAQARARRYVAGDGGSAEFDWCAGVCGGCEGRSFGDIARRERVRRSSMSG